MGRTFKITPHECALLSEKLGWLRRRGANIPPTPELIEELIALAERVYKDDALWARMPASIEGWTRDGLRQHIQRKAEHALS